MILNIKIKMNKFKINKSLKVNINIKEKKLFKKMNNLFLKKKCQMTINKTLILIMRKLMNIQLKQILNHNYKRLKLRI